MGTFEKVMLRILALTVIFAAFAHCQYINGTTINGQWIAPAASCTTVTCSVAYQRCQLGSPGTTTLDKCCLNNTNATTGLANQQGFAVWIATVNGTQCTASGSSGSSSDDSDGLGTGWIILIVVAVLLVVGVAVYFLCFSGGEGGGSGAGGSAVVARA